MTGNDLSAAQALFLQTAKLPGIQFGNAVVSSKLLFTFRDLASEGRSWLEKQLFVTSRAPRVLAAQLLGQLAWPESAPALQAAAMDDDAQVSTAASRALAFLEGEPAREALNQLAISPKNRGIHLNAIFGLCRLQDPRGIAHAKTFLDDQKQTAEARAALAGNLAMLGQANIVPVLEHAMGLFPNHGPLKGLAVECYLAVGSPDAVAKANALSKALVGPPSPPPAPAMTEPMRPLRA